MRMRTIAQLALAGLVLAAVGTAIPAQSANEAGVVHFAALGDFGSDASTRWSFG